MSVCIGPSRRLLDLDAGSLGFIERRMSDSESPPPEAPKPPKSAASPRQPDRAKSAKSMCSSDSDGSASIDEDDLSESGSEDYCETARRGGSRRTSTKSPMRKRRKRPEWTRNEEETLAQVHCGVGNQWSVIAARLPGRTANEVKNIWHSTLRSKHLKARSLLRAYATALNGRWDDETARQEAYEIALGQQGTSAPHFSAGPLQAGLVLNGMVGHDDAAQTPRLCIVTGLTGAGGLPELKPAGAQTPDSSRSPAVMSARQRAGRCPPATAPRPLASDKAAGRGVQQRQQQARADLIETRGATTAQVRRSLDVTMTLPLDGPAQGDDAAPEIDAATAATPANEYGALPAAAAAATTAARPLPLSFGGAWGQPVQLPQRPWPAPHPVQFRSILDEQPPHRLGQQQEHEQQLQQEQKQETQQQAPMLQLPPGEMQLVPVVTTKIEPKEQAEGSQPHLIHGSSQRAHGLVLGLDSMDTWLGRLDPSMMLQDDDGAARDQVCHGGADSSNNNSSIARVMSVSATAAVATAAPGQAGDGADAHHQLAGASGDPVESGPASGAWSSNSGAVGPQLPSPPPDSAGASLHHPAPQAAVPDSSTAMAISPTARAGSGGCGENGATHSGAQDDFNLPSSQWHQGAAAAASFGSQDGVSALPYGAPTAAGMYAAPPGAILDAEGHSRAIAPQAWPLAAPRLPVPFAGRSAPVGLAHEAWRGPMVSQQQQQQLRIRGGAGGMAVDVHSGGMYMVPVHAPPVPTPPQPHMIVFAPQPPQALQTYHGHPHYEQIARRLRQREHMMYQQQQQYIQQQQQQFQQQQQQYQHQEHIAQQQQAYQQAGQRQQQQQFPEFQQLQQQQLKQEPQEEEHYQLPSEAQLQQQLSAHHQLHLQQQSSLPSPQQPLLQQQLQQLQQQHGQQLEQQQQAQQALEQQTDSMSSSDVITMGLDSLHDPQLRWCLMDME
ncbi:hypothetical protein PLESTB_001107200 [Pleodorina starrii]|uniref:Uncharacterized protein n=1 Tax=Pleodorina starrii TaxID=330485 RepID=A0A9W6F5J1_9CHLO|nr:hypothetical protein PLESTB_001107200 [Pleodorina starrii]